MVGTACLVSFTLRANERADDPTGRAGTPPCSECCAPVTSCPHHPPRPKLGLGNRTSGAGPQSRSSRLVRRASRSPSARLVSRRPQIRRPSRMGQAIRASAAPEDLAHRSQCCGASVHLLQTSSPVQPTALPRAAPPSWAMGTCGGIFDAVGRATGSPHRLRSSHQRTLPTSHRVP